MQSSAAGATQFARRKVRYNGPAHVPLQVLVPVGIWTSVLYTWFNGPTPCSLPSNGVSVLHSSLLIHRHRDYATGDVCRKGRRRLHTVCGRCGPKQLSNVATLLTMLGYCPSVSLSALPWQQLRKLSYQLSHSLSPHKDKTQQTEPNWTSYSLVQFQFRSVLSRRCEPALTQQILKRHKMSSGYTIVDFPKDATYSVELCTGCNIFDNRRPYACSFSTKVGHVQLIERITQY